MQLYLNKLLVNRYNSNKIHHSVKKKCTMYFSARARSTVQPLQFTEYYNSLLRL